jgi:glycosyltransferase involved in cell wall biosynthesis
MADRPVEVLHVLESLGHGGAEQNLLSVLRCLPPDRFRNHLAWLYDDERLLESFRPHVASLVPLRAHGRLGLFRATAHLTQWLRQHRPDVVHTQLVRAQLVGRASARLARRLPVVTTWQNVFYDDEALSDFRHSRLLRALVRSLDRVSGKSDSRFIAVSEHVAAQMSCQMGVDRSRISVIFNSVEPERYAPALEGEVPRLQRALDLTPGAPVLLAVGRLVEQKGHRRLIEAMPDVLARFPRSVLLIAGRGPLQSELEQKIRSAGLAGQIRLLGARNDIPTLCQLADLFVFPSRYEGLSVALVEALTNGLPAVVSDLPQNREVAQGISSVRFVRSDDAGGWARAIVSLLEPKERLRTPEGDRLRLQTCFSPRHLAKLVGEILTHSARNPGAPFRHNTSLVERRA